MERLPGGFTVTGDRQPPRKLFPEVSASEAPRTTLHLSSAFPGKVDMNETGSFSAENVTHADRFH